MTAPEHQDHGRLLAPRWRASALATVLVCVVVVLVLALRYAHQRQAGGLDRAVDDWLTGHVNFRTALWFADLGNGPVVLVLVAALIVGCVLLHIRRGLALVVLASVTAPSLTEWVLKPAVHRTKDGYLAYPSGHATGFCTVAFVLVLLVLGPVRHRFRRRFVVSVSSVALLLAAACAVGLVATDFHYATDVLGGIGVAGATVLTLALAIDAVDDRRQPDR